MKQLRAVIIREIKLKIKSKSFYLFILVTPVLFLVPIAISIFSNPVNVAKQQNIVGVLSPKTDSSKDTINFRGLKFFYLTFSGKKELVQSNFLSDKRVLGAIDLSNNQLNKTSGHIIKFYIKKSKLANKTNKIKDIESFVNQLLINQMIKDHHLSVLKLRTVYPITIKSALIAKAMLSTAIAFVLGMLIYISMILFNNALTRGMFEEKSNKLAEVLSLFIKPEKLIIGKIIGLGIASLIQFILWLGVFYLYNLLISTIASTFFPNSANADYTIGNLIISLKDLPVLDLVLYLPLFFILGFILNGAITAFIGIYSGNKGAQHMSFIGNIINLIAIYFAMYAALNPDSPLIKSTLYIPVLSYLTVPVLLPHNIPPTKIIVSLFLLAVAAFFMLYLSGKLYKKFIFNDYNKKMKNI